MAIVGLLALYVGGFGRPAFAQPECPAPTQWKQSIERPNEDWDYDGKRILGHLGYDIFLWDAETGKLLQRMKGHRERIRKVQLSPDGKFALSSSWLRPGPMVPYRSKDTRTILWNLATGQHVHFFPGQVAGEFSPDGTRIVSFSQRARMSDSFDAAIWDVQTGREVARVTLESASGLYSDDLHFSLDGTRFVYMNNRGAEIYNSSDGREIGHLSVISRFHHYCSNGSLACFDSEKASVIDIESGRTLRSIEHGVTGLWRGAWTHDGRKVAAYPVNGAIQIWDLETGTTITGAQGGTHYQRYAIISPDNNYFAIEWCEMNAETRKDEPAFGLYDMSTGQEIAVHELAKYGNVIGFAPDSKTFLVGGPQYEEYTSENKKKMLLPEFVIYNSENGNQIRSLTLEHAPISRE